MPDVIKAVFLDIDNTLLDFDRGAELSSLAAAAELGVTLPEGIMETFHQVSNPLWKSLQDGEITLEDLYRLRWQRIFDRLGLPYDGVAFERPFRRYLAESAVPVEGAMELLAYLRRRYILCAASNGPHAQQRNRLERAGMLPFFDRCFISEALGAAKPQRAFFDACFAALEGVAPAETVLIGDSLTADIDGARAYGMHPCWFNKRHRPLPEEPIERVVTSLAEIRSFL